MKHHAYLYCNPDLSLTGVPLELHNEGVDTVHLRTDALGIEEARTVRVAAYQRPVVASRRAFIIVARTMTLPAQNALLKLFEEPPLSAEFHLVVPHEHVVIPTLRSRLLLVGEGAAFQTANPPWAAFCVLPLAARLEEITNRTKAKDAAWIEAITAGAARDSRVPRAVAFTVSRFLGHSGASKKMLLEYLALSIPVGSKAA
jgi:hypothetical protein